MLAGILIILACGYQYLLGKVSTLKDAERAVEARKVSISIR